jgi:hypothetical protein
VANLQMKRLFSSLLVFIFVAAIPASAHVGSPDVFLEGNAGPYRLFVTVRVPQVIPGVADIEIRSESNDVSDLRIAPMQLTGPGSQFAPTPDVAQRSKTDPQFFTASVWLMEFGSLQVRIDADGSRGKGELAVPVPAVAQRMLPMQKPLGILLFGLMLLLASALISIASAAVREGDLAAGAAAPAVKVRRARIALVIAGVVVATLLFVGRQWWNSDASRYARNVYSPPEIQASLDPSGLLVLHQGTARIASGNPRRPADVINFENLILDHGHLMHFFMIRTPAMDSFWHLHPERSGPDGFVVHLPAIPPGHYELFADVVLTSGFPVTMVGQIDVPDISGLPLTGDDSGILSHPISSSANDTESQFSDGGRIVWERPSGPLKSNAPVMFHFRVEDSNGKPSANLEPYMGMAAHAEIVRSDGSVFAHVHPAGSVAMAALELAQAGFPGSAQATGPSGMASMPGMNMPAEHIDPEISFPYGFPKAGRYRVFVQIKRSGHVETGVFDVPVE